MGSKAPPAGEDADKRGARRVRRRRVLYVHGFDPAPSARYRRLIRRAGETRGGAVPAMTEIGPISDVSEGWRITADEDGQAVETVFEILRYEDIVRRWRNRPFLARTASGLAGWARFLASGGLRRAAALAKGPAVLFFYPVFMIAVFIGLGVLAGRYAGEIAEAAGAPDWASQVGRALGALAGVWAGLRLERAFFSHLMLALFDCLIRIAEDRPPAGQFDLRIAAFADRIGECVAEADRAKVDEILIVGHSLGGFVALRALARALARDVDLTGGRAEIGFLTLGSVAGYVACRGGPGAEDFANDVVRVAVTPELTWVDVSAPRDWFSFGLVDPLLLVDKAPRAARSPLVISAKFGRFTPDPDDARTRFRAMGLHMKYLAAPDQAGAFDFFAAAAGAKTLGDRFGGRRHSPKARMRGP